MAQQHLRGKWLPSVMIWQGTWVFNWLTNIPIHTYQHPSVAESLLFSLCRSHFKLGPHPFQGSCCLKKWGLSKMYRKATQGCPVCYLNRGGVCHLCNWAWTQTSQWVQPEGCLSPCLFPAFCWRLLQAGHSEGSLWTALFLSAGHT